MTDPVLNSPYRELDYYSLKMLGAHPVQFTVGSRIDQIHKYAKFN